MAFINQVSKQYFIDNPMALINWALVKKIKECINIVKDYMIFCI